MKILLKLRTEAEISDSKKGAYIMQMNGTPSSMRAHISFFGNTNAGKSSIVNAITNQSLSIVSDVKGTTTDPVYKTMELLPIGPVVIIDTPGLDDDSILAEQRIAKTNEVLNRTDIAVIVVDGTKSLDTNTTDLLKNIKSKSIPYVIAVNKCDETSFKVELADNFNSENVMNVSAVNNINIHELKEMLGRLYKENQNDNPIVGDLLSHLDNVIMVVPIDSAAPKNRLILPQQMVLRDIIDSGAYVTVCRESELEQLLKNLAKKPDLVITDSQVFKLVNNIVPPDIQLTSFSILMARHKGNLYDAVKGASYINKLKDGDTVLISEGCTHHRQCEDIGTVKLPKWIKDYTGKELNFEFTSGREFPSDLSRYALIVHCGACMLNEKEMKHRYEIASTCNVPITNYGIIIAYINGILKRSIMPFDDINSLI